MGKRVTFSKEFKFEAVRLLDLDKKSAVELAQAVWRPVMPPDLKKLKRLDVENAWMKKLVADLSLDKAMLQDVIRRKT